MRLSLRFSGESCNKSLDDVPGKGYNIGMETDLFTLSAPAPPPGTETTPPTSRHAVCTGAGGLVECPHFTLEEHGVSGYGPRTFANAKADATWAYAVDFTTSGEQLTKRAAGERILQIPVGTTTEVCARLLTEHLRKLGARSLNVAGNGIYTLAQHYPTGQPQDLQAKLDTYVLKVLTLVHTEYPLSQVRSGGQTGVDEAGIKAGIALGIPTLALLPNGFRIRNAIGVDITMTRKAAWRRFVTNPPDDSIF